jgi:spermidine synthase
MPRTRVPFALFFLSGASSLVLEVAWVRQFSLTLGNTVLSTTAVLAAYMGGLALGSFLSGRYAERLRRPILAYGLLEGIIGIYALLLPFLIRLSEPLFRAVYDDLVGAPAAMTALRFLVALVLLLVPTTLMGATLPLLSQAMTLRPRDAGAVGGRLYAANLLGAAAGSFLGGFALLPVIGLSRSVLLAAGVNFLIAATAWIVFRTPPKAAAKAAAATPAEPAGPLTGASRIAIALYALSGVASMVYQVTWVRLLSLIFGSSVFSFSVTVTVFIVGLAAGDWYFSTRRPGKDGLWVLGWILTGVGLASAAALPVIQHLPEWTFDTVRDGASFPALLRFQVLWTFALLLVPTFFIGAVFPVAVGILARSGGSPGRTVGVAYFWNTIGAILGTLAGGLLLVPQLGIQESMLVAVALSLLGGAFGLFRSRRVPTVRRTLAGALILAAAAVWFLPLRLSADVLSSGPYHPRTQAIVAGQGSGQGFREFASGKSVPIVFSEEGMAATVAVRRHPEGDLSLVIGGKVDASINKDGGDLPTQVMLSALPLLLKPGAEDVLVIGLASGVSVGAAEAFPVDAVDCVEISPAVVHACRRFFEDHNGNALEDPRLRLILTDARHHVTMTDRAYDVVVSEPSNPWIAGINALFTREFFETVKTRLRPGGLFCQWFHAYDMSEEGVGVIIRTFCRAFPHVLLWESDGGDYFLVGSLEPVRVDPGSLARTMEGNADLRDWLRKAGIGEPAALFGNLVSGEDALREAVGPGPVNTDDNGFLEYHAPYYMYRRARPSWDFLAGLRMADPSPLYTGLGAEDQATVLRAARARLLAYEAGREDDRGRADLVEQRYDEAFTLHPVDPLIRLRRAFFLQQKAAMDLQNQDMEGGFKAFRKLLAGVPINAEAMFRCVVHTGIASAYNTMNRPQEALAELDMAAKYVPNYNRMWHLRGLVLFRLNRPQESLAALTRAEELGNRDLQLYLALAILQLRTGAPGDAMETLSRAETLYPGDPRIADVRLRMGG